jgi:putative addiction module component (TIGR02574 family)
LNGPDRFVYSSFMATLTHDEITRLSPEERLALIGDLWDSLTDDELPLSSAQRAEIERRLLRFDEDRPQATTWEDLKAELARRLP